MHPSSSANSYFRFTRFAQLFARHTAEHWRGYLMTAAVGGGLMLLVTGFLTYLQKSPPSVGGQTVLFILFLLAGGSVFASTVFSQFGERRRATVALLLPASHLEKYLVAWLYSVPLFLLVFVPLFYAVMALVCYAVPGQTPALLDLWAKREDAAGIFWMFMLLHGLGLLGSIYFQKAQFIKTAFVTLGVLTVLWLLNYQALRLLLGASLQVSPPFTDPILVEGEQYFKLSLAEGQLPWLSLLPLALAALLWLAAYFRLTEKQL